MLPILRTISVGGVLLAITILGLALIPPSRTHFQLTAAEMPARGPLIDRYEHPEWRQIVIRSALKRADELGRLRDLPGMPIPSSMPDGLSDSPNREPSLDRPMAATNPESQLAGLPAARSEAGTEDETGSIGVTPNATIPIDIGETSSFELPVAPVEENPPVAKAPVVGATSNDATSTEPPATAIEPPLAKVSTFSPPEEPKPVVVIRKQSVRKPAAKPPAAAAQTEPTVPPPFNILQAFFASLAGKSSASTEPPKKAVVLRRPRIKAKKTAAAR